MPCPPVLPTLAAVAVLGAAGGVQLGRAAVKEIPARYFAPPEGTQSFAALSANRGWERAEASWTASRSYEGYDPGYGCVGCRTYPEEYHPIHDPSVDGYDDGYSASAPEPIATPEFQYAVEEDVAEGPAEPDMKAIERYASFPVTLDEAEDAVAVDADRPSADPL